MLALLDFFGNWLYFRLLLTWLFVIMLLFIVIDRYKKVFCLTMFYIILLLFLLYALLHLSVRTLVHLRGRRRLIIILVMFGLSILLRRKYFWRCCIIWTLKSLLGFLILRTLLYRRICYLWLGPFLRWLLWLNLLLGILDSHIRILSIKN